MGVQNGAYTGIASYIDAPWPWDPANERTVYVERTFHGYHATQWCASTTSRTSTRCGRGQTRPAHRRQGGLYRRAPISAVRHLRVGNTSAATTSPAYVYSKAQGMADPLTASRYCAPGDGVPSPRGGEGQGEGESLPFVTSGIAAW